jgi:hypothetical protein
MLLDLKNFVKFFKLNIIASVESTPCLAFSTAVDLDTHPCAAAALCSFFHCVL